MSSNDAEKYQFLSKLAVESGAADAKIIPANQVVIEDRVVLKCKVGCNHYGETLACPPYTPTAEQFRKIVSEYSYAMFMKFTTTASCEPEVYPHLMTYQTNPAVSQDIKDKAAKFWQGWKDSKQKMLVSVVGLGKSRYESRATASQWHSYQATANSAKNATPKQKSAATPNSCAYQKTPSA